jgi:6-phosphogluconolactonase
MVDVYRFPDENTTIGALADYVISDICRALKEQAGYRWALAGGRSPKPLYQRLALPEISRQVDWDRVRVFWGDERCVPPDDPGSNYRMAKETLLDHIPIPCENVYPIDGTSDPETSALSYSSAIGTERFDLILLGMGEDGHTASLFPSTPNLRADTRRVIATRSPLPPVHRISLSLGTINASRKAIFLVFGEAKSARIADVMDQLNQSKPILPAAMVNPPGGALLWFMDYAAASRLDSAIPGQNSRL